MKILVADDDAVYRRLLRLPLEKSGHEVVETTNGAEAWERLSREDTPPLAILDWVMPPMSGVEVCRKVREQAASRALYLILVTSRQRPEDIVAGLEAGADDYMAKPFNPAELRARVQVGVRIVELQEGLADRVRQLEEALAQVHRLQGLIPICAWCRKVRRDQHYWQQVESYIAEHTGVRFSHGICPECREKLVARRDANG